MTSKLTVLLVGVEISDQYGTSETFVVGVFDSIGDIEGAKKTAKEKFRNRRTFFREVQVEINQSVFKRPELTDKRKELLRLILGRDDV